MKKNGLEKDRTGKGPGTPKGGLDQMQNRGSFQVSVPEAKTRSIKTETFLSIANRKRGRAIGGKKNAAQNSDKGALMIKSPRISQSIKKGMV